MRIIILFIASSLDGFIARENGDVSWLFTDADYGYKNFYKSVDTVIMGRKTYEKSLEFEKEPYKDKKCYVFSRNKSPRKFENVEFVNDAVSFAKKIIKSKGRDIWLVGGSDIISIFLNNGLLDEVIIYQHPVILGRGIPLFKKIKKDVKLKFVKSRIYKSGLVQLNYEVLK